MGARAWSLRGDDGAAGAGGGTDRPPSVDRLARSIASAGLPWPLLVEISREAIATGSYDDAASRAKEVSRSLLRPVINGTGIIAHTNLGRSPLPASPPSQRLRASNLEYDLSTGRRGSRDSHTARLMARLCGTEDAHVVNNGAAALLLALTALAAGREVLVSRGELVEIGGGFRIPEVIAASGCHLIEVGTTNKTRLADYERNISSDSALILKVHQSNYHMQGFVAAASIQELAGLGLPVLVDLGSGLIDDRVPWLKGPPPAWLKGEPAVRQTLSQGAAAVTFSGDKLLGGPQAGLIAGQREIVRRCAQHPMSRALRAGGLVLSNLQRTILAYMNKDLDELPLWKMASYSPADLEARARRIGIGAVARCTAKMGAGSLPGRGLESVGVAVKGDHRGRLLAFEPPIVSRVLKGHTLIDLRTVDPADDEVVAAALSSIVQESGSQSLDRIAALDLTEAPID